MAPLTAAMQFRSGTESYMQVRSGDDLGLSTVMARDMEGVQSHRDNQLYHVIPNKRPELQKWPYL